ncbi:MAG: hypothetical protein PUE78_00425 [Clostridia bacterium]|nr:hypothetical protein [Clostridia bacterium]
MVESLEESDMDYDDGAETIVLYTKGKKGKISEEIRQFLHYMEYTNQKNAVNEDLKDIQQMVDVVKRDGGVVEMYEEALLSPDISWDELCAVNRKNLPPKLYKYQSFFQGDGRENIYWIRNVQGELFEMYTDMFLIEYIILAMHMNSQGMVSDNVLDELKNNVQLMK